MTILLGGSCSSILAFELITAYFVTEIGAMEGMLLACVFLLMCPGIGTLPKGEPYTWQRPVPGWRQAKETVTLENKGFYFEAAEFEAHFRDQGKLDGELLHFIRCF